MVPESIQQLSSPAKGVHKEEAVDVDDRTKTRHPRWTRQETFVLIEGKKSVENRYERCRRSTSALGSDQSESKWDLVSSYCRQNGVNRGPAQCRKRWGNMICDFKKIRTWESKKGNEAESFWMMRNESRRQRKLPGFFDREIYDLLDGKMVTTEAIPLALIAVKKEIEYIDPDEEATAEEDEEEEEHGVTEAAFDGGQHEQSGQDENYRSSKKETITARNLRKTQETPLPRSSAPAGTANEQNSGSDTWIGSSPREGRKKRTLSSNQYNDTDLGNRLIQVLGRNMNMMNSQLEVQTINCELDRQQRKDQNDSLVSVLNKLTDALVKIADKL